MFNMRKSVNWTFSHHLQLLVVIGLFNGYHVIAISSELPCRFIDSIDISGGAKQLNLSIIYDGVEFTPADYAEMDHDLINGTEQIAAQAHIRGCLCNRKPCIRVNKSHVFYFEIFSKHKPILKFAVLLSIWISSEDAEWHENVCSA